MNTYICDIDGTIADNKHREWILKEPGKKDWDHFFSLMGADKPIMHMNRLLADLVQAGSKIVYFTGRPEAYRNLTTNWLIKWGFPTECSLYMRENGDYRADETIKLEIYKRYIQNNEPPVMVFDDRNSVVRMWRTNEIPCAQVAEGDF